MAKKTTEIDPNVTKAMNDNGDCAPFKVGGKLFIFRPLSLDEYEDFQARGLKAQTPGPINRECCLKAVVYPEGDVGVAALKEAFERPGATSFATLASTAIIQMSFADIEVVAKKG